MFDYIIIGAGSAGCVLATRLSADPKRKVLLLEAGKPDRDPLLHMPGGVAALMKSGKHDWRYHTTPQTHLDNREIYYPRGKVLGGSSSTNAMIAVRGAPSDYDHWAQLGLPGWSYDKLLPYFKRLETYLPHQGPRHGTDGPLKISRIAQRSPMGRAWLAAAHQAGHPYNDDFAGPSLEGVGQFDSNIFQGRRQSAAVAYLRPALQRPNLTVLTEALTLRVLFTGTRATAVEYRHQGNIVQATAGVEIILSGGAVNSPQLLMLSGIGAPERLSAHGIARVVDLPGVGRNLHDHLVATVGYASPLPHSYVTYRKPHRMLLAGLQYFLLRRGIAAEPGPLMAGFLKTSLDLAEPDIQYHFVSIMYHDNGRSVSNEHGSMAMCNICQPQSRGTVTLRSGNPEDAPLIDPNFFAEEYDRRTMLAGLRLAREIVNQPAFRPYHGAEVAPGAAAQDDASLEAYVRANAETIYHPVGTCAMGTNAEAVVDAQLRVHGTQGLRVVDASVMPRIISGNTNLATMMIAEKAADMILGYAAA
ncbi:GMC family oxidoreductase [Acidocella sp.]|uniref:GMC family oxidoreductase n=1 Tax=Acidocella sp. TaxID=50710 RepID=UPI002612CECD|nr:choline dehydrogenase [Acidocella sp.]